MKNLKKYAFVLLVLAFTIGLTANASGLFQKIEAYLNTAVKLTVNDKEFVPIDENGNALRPITYNDRTYLPVRAISEALEKDVSWDEKTQTVNIAKKKTEAKYMGHITSIAESTMTIYAIDEGYRGYLVVDINADTKMGVGVKEQLKVDTLVTITTDGTLVRGILPEVKAISIDEAMTGAMEEGIVVSKGEGYFEMKEGNAQDPTKVNISDTTVFQNCTFESLKVNDKVKIYTTGISLMIYPPQRGALRVVLE